MKNLFNYDSKFMCAATKLANLLWLGVLTVLCCLPVLTAGAALTAMYYTVFQMKEHGTDSVWGPYWRAFRSNFVKATLLWLPVLAGAYLLWLDYGLLTAPDSRYSLFYKVLTALVALLFAGTALMVFPMQARFENSWWNMLKNSLMLSLLHLPGTVLMLLTAAAPVLVAVLWPASFPVVLVLGLTAPAYMNASLLLKYFGVRLPRETEGPEE